MVIRWMVVNSKMTSPAFLPAKIFGATRVPTRSAPETTDLSAEEPTATDRATDQTRVQLVGCTRLASYRIGDIRIT